MEAAASCRETESRVASSMNGPGNNVDEIRYKNYLLQMERDQDSTVKDKEDQHRERLTNLVTNHEEQTKTLKKDYDVKISEEAEALEMKLGQIRERNQSLTNLEKENGEAEAQKIHHQYEQKTDSEKKTGDEQISKLQAYYKRASDELHKQYEKDRVRTTQKAKPA